MEEEARKFSLSSEQKSALVGLAAAILTITTIAIIVILAGGKG